MNSRDKGKRGELELVHFLKDRGIDAHRSQQYCGASGDADVIAAKPLHQTHLEVKRREAGNVYNWLAQAIAEAKDGKMPVVAHKRNGKDWIVILELDKFLSLMERLHAQPAE